MFTVKWKDNMENVASTEQEKEMVDKVKQQAYNVINSEGFKSVVNMMLEKQIDIDYSIGVVDGIYIIEADTKDLAIEVYSKINDMNPPESKIEMTITEEGSDYVMLEPTPVGAELQRSLLDESMRMLNS